MPDNTVITSSTAYCTPTQLLDYVDWEIVADSLRDGNGPRPLKATILNSATAVGGRLNTLCKAASGELESACLARELYSVADLQSLTGSTAAFLQQVVAGLVIMRCFARRMPIAGRPEDIPAIRAATEAMEQLGAGKRIFGLALQADAGAGMTPIKQSDIVDAGGETTVTRAYRYFGSRHPRNGFDSGC